MTRRGSNRRPARRARRSPSFSRRIELAVPLGEDHLLTTGQLVRGCDVADRAVQADLVVMRHELCDEPPRVLQAQGGLDADALSFQGLEPTLHLPIALRIVWRCSHMSHPADPDELLEVPGDELRPVVRDDPGPRIGEPLARPLDDRLDLGLGHALTDLPVDEEPAVAVEE